MAANIFRSLVFLLYMAGMSYGTFALLHFVGRATPTVFYFFTVIAVLSLLVRLHPFFVGHPFEEIANLSASSLSAMFSIVALLILRSISEMEKPTSFLPVLIVLVGGCVLTVKDIIDMIDRRRSGGKSQQT